MKMINSFLQGAFCIHIVNCRKNFVGIITVNKYYRDFRQAACISLIFWKLFHANSGKLNQTIFAEIKSKLTSYITWDSLNILRQDLRIEINKKIDGKEIYFIFYGFKHAKREASHLREN